LQKASEATFVGSATCAECHAEQARTYRQSAHSLALSDIDVSREPPDVTFLQQASGRTYTVHREGGQLRHREAMIDESGEIAASDYPVRYLIGSGRHARSYLVEIDGFLCESPLTWYASRQSWDMSPGYDRRVHAGFERAVESGCLFCHVGRLADRAYQRLQVVEQPIGCERCHGPGSLHVGEQRSNRQRPGEAGAGSHGIVNPATLPRGLNEAICSQCHVNTDAATLVHGRELADFRPGLRLADFCIDYIPKLADSRMTVVGHVEQMRLSRCYQASETLTCTTCHDPHSDLEPSQKKAHFVQVCLQCHTDQSCGLDLEKRQASGSDCVVCHMPQVDTEVRHVAFTHHRIGVHSHEPESGTTKDSHDEIVDLIPLDEPQQLSDIDHQRNLGLAYFALAQRQPEAAPAKAYRERARRLLEEVLASGHLASGKVDGEAVAALVRLFRGSNSDLAARLAREALASGGLTASSEITCLFFTAEWSVHRGQPAKAEVVLERLVETRLLSEDWRLLGICRGQTADWAGAGAALERACAIAPFRPEIRTALAEVYQRLGRQQDAQREGATAARLIAHAQRGPQP
jgi:predicted CXXCH cytochrome family protein